jgi:hypothetical protein
MTRSSATEQPSRARWEVPHGPPARIGSCAPTTSLTRGSRRRRLTSDSFRKLRRQSPHRTLDLDTIFEGPRRRPSLDAEPPVGYSYGVASSPEMGGAVRPAWPFGLTTARSLGSTGSPRRTRRPIRPGGVSA